MPTENPSIQPPAFDEISELKLVSEKNSKIISISVYSGRAEVTRLFKFGVKTGQNQVEVVGLPSAMDQQSFRVEGRGSATIHDVTIAYIPLTPKSTTSEKLTEPESSLTKTTKALLRAEMALKALESYLGSLNSQHTDVSKLQTIVTNYDETAEKLDDKITELRARKIKLESEIKDEKKALDGPRPNEKLALKATIGVFADHEGDVEIALIYAVSNATWTAAYDIRVDMDTKDKPVDLIYKGAITQNTGEDWTDVPIALETAAPTFGLGIPTLSPWTLSVYSQPFGKHKPYSNMSKHRGGGGALMPAGMGGAQEEYPQLQAQAYSVSLDMGFGSGESEMQHRSLQVSSKGNITATFTVPGLMTIPSDNVAHNVTIAQLELDATMEWVSVPKLDAKVHLKAIVKNASEYTLLSGPGSVYVDGSFIARTDVPAVSPEETFDCPLGLDPSVRVTYAPLSKKATQSGFMTKTRIQNFTQRINIHNTKSSTIGNIKIFDQVPVSEDSVITAKLISPSLQVLDSNGDTAAGLSALSRPGGGVKNKLGVHVPAPISISQGITVQWDGADEAASDSDALELGKNGKLVWNCAIPAQGKINLSLQWEVSAPLRTAIVGL
ncbi:mucoidy inhibitor A [Coprinopsis marcescibilis]|uniref:Mucoidy inhibitor A n=1 Tax=Coprinopsis marcescibilis TaxID=230819 RepID=A0A5C3KR62_COPMA|nr:mucoidy inhibitor A [Coprinopsis marcescibilis]